MAPEVADECIERKSLPSSASSASSSSWRCRRRRHRPGRPEAAASASRMRADAAMLAVWIAVVLVVGLLNAQGGDCLKNVSLRVEPPSVERGQGARLVCDYDLEGAPLYSVKWYRGQHEFFRYTAFENTTKVFPRRGISVDTSHSNATQVVLMDVGFSLTGNVTCEVTTDRPRHMMVQSKAFMTVVALPRSPPKLWAHRERYQPGDSLFANCTSPPSTPPAQLSFQINNRTVPSSDTWFHDTTDGEQWSALSINMPLDTRHFRAGRLTLQCTATVTADFTVKSEAQELGVRPTEPVPERVTSAQEGHARPLLLLVLLALGLRR